MKTKHLIIFLIASIYACTPKSIRLENDTAVMKTFSKDEIKELSVLITIFDDEIKKIQNTENTDEAYHMFLESLRYTESIEELLKKTSVLQPAVDSALNYFTKSKIFEGTFSINYSYFIHNRNDTASVFIEPANQGKYFLFLENISQEDKRFVEYNNTILATATIPPSLVLAPTLLHKDLDFNKESNRLMVVFHYLILHSNKDYKTNKKAYR